MRISRDVWHGASHYARREYGIRNGEVGFLASNGPDIGYGLSPRAAILDLIHDRTGRKRRG